MSKTALEHYNIAERLLGRAAAQRGEGVARNLVLAAVGHALLANAGVTALASFNDLPDRDRMGWMHAAGEYGAPAPRKLALVTEEERCISCGHVPEDECVCVCCPPEEETGDGDSGADTGTAGDGDGDCARGAVGDDRDDPPGGSTSGG
jgi:hypothetical protein